MAIDRKSMIETLRNRPDTPVLIIGGGINGCGIFRDLAAQGVAALLIDRGDIGGGTSAAPSRLIHGGLRYLETGEFRLVRESVRARDHLLRNAPHLVTPIPTWVPVTSWTGGTLAALGRALGLVRTPGRKGAIPLALGLNLYDRFSTATRLMPHHRFLRAATARRQIPLLAGEVRIVGEYYDARISHPERLPLELIEDGEADCPGAMGLPYVALEAIEGSAVILRDMIRGEMLTVRPQLVINAAGAWVDQVNQRLGQPEPLIGGTKGSHLVLRRADLAAMLGPHMLYFETPDHRACLIYALDPDHVLLGTTDLRTDNPDDRCCTAAEIDYLFTVLNSVLPGHGLRRGDIVLTYAGVRPLPRSSAGATGAISRDHRLVRCAPSATTSTPIMALVGGKWTTYRDCAAEVTDAILAALGRQRRIDTTGLAIGGGRDWPTGGLAVIAARLTAEHGVPSERAAILARRYGTTAAAVAAASHREGDDRPLTQAPSYHQGELRWLATTGRVNHLEDMILRRTLIAFEGLATPAVIAEVAAIIGPALGWTTAVIAAEQAATLERLNSHHGIA